VDGGGARAYVAASNAHDLDAIAPLFAEGADYVSARTGSFSGVSDIIAMMTQFFEIHPHAHWLTRDWREIEGNGVEFDFELTAGGAPRRGTERSYQRRGPHPPHRG